MNPMMCFDMSFFISLSGGLTSAQISFTALHTEPNVSPPEFTLTCRSVGGPATTVSWQRNGATVEEDSDHETSQIIVDTTANTVYENRLRVRGREGGEYQCTVSGRNSITSLSFTVMGRWLHVIAYVQSKPKHYTPKHSYFFTQSNLQHAT